MNALEGLKWAKLPREK